MMKNHTPRRRWINHVLIDVSIALALIFGSAWWITWRDSVISSANMGMVGVDGYPDRWIEPVPEDWPEVPLSNAFSASAYVTPDGFNRVPRGLVAQGMFLGVSASAQGVSYSIEGGGQIIERIEVGWVTHVLTQRGALDTRDRASTALGRLYIEGIPVPGYTPLGFAHNRKLPVRPIWVPFVLTLIVVSVVIELLWQLFTLRPKLRHRYRVRNNLCLSCGYAIEDQTLCPECGKSPE